MDVGNPADRLNSDLNTLVRDKRANHKHNQSVLGKTKLMSLSGAGPKSIAINAIRDEAAIPVISVSTKEVRIYADQAITTKETIFRVTRARLAHKCRPIAVMCDKYMT